MSFVAVESLSKHCFPRLETLNHFQTRQAKPQESTRPLGVRCSSGPQWAIKLLAHRAPSRAQRLRSKWFKELQSKIWLATKDLIWQWTYIDLTMAIFIILIEVHHIPRNITQPGDRSQPVPSSAVPRPKSAISPSIWQWSVIVFRRET